jgi:hypothetical protein
MELGLVYCGGVGVVLMNLGGGFTDELFDQGSVRSTRPFLQFTALSHLPCSDKKPKELINHGWLYEYIHFLSRFSPDQ